MTSQRPVQFRAIHTKKRWRKASHETMENATIRGNRSARALFRGENDAVDLAKHGDALYVVVWRTGDAYGYIYKPNPNRGDGIERSRNVSLETIEAWERDRTASLEVLESYFEETVRQQEQAAAISADTDGEREGDLNLSEHYRRERSRRLRGLLLAERQRTGTLWCDLCGTNGSHFDPPLISAIFECHHLVPLAQSGLTVTTTGELALLCANCHRVIHHAMSSLKKWIDVSEAKTFLSK